jgi:hypothetical protein
MVHQLPDNESNLTIPSALVTMERRRKRTSQYDTGHDIIFMTPRVAETVAEVQKEQPDK